MTARKAKPTRTRRPGVARSAEERLARIGMTGAEAHAKGALYARLDTALTAAGAGRTRWSIWSPGRIEVLGKHTDYAGGRSLLCAVERGVCLRASARDDRVVRVIDVVRAQSRELPLAPDTRGEDNWTAYVAAVIRRLTRNFPNVTRGVDIALGSDLPRAAGMSSSSALLIAVVSALGKANGLASSNEFRAVISSREELAAYLACVENGNDFRALAGDTGVGTLGGAQDHTAILCSEPDRLVQYAWSPPPGKREAVLPFSNAYVLVIASSGVAAEKIGAARDAYNRASLAVRHLLAQWNGLTYRNDTSLGMAIASGDGARERLARLARENTTGAFDAAYLGARLEQFHAEANRIIPAASAAFRAGDLGAFGALVDWSQWATEALLQNQVPETVHLAASARRLGALAASAFGAGFGGSVYALVRRARASAFLEKWRTAYSGVFPTAAARAEFFITRPGPAAHQW